MNGVRHNGVRNASLFTLTRSSFELAEVLALDGDFGTYVGVGFG